VAMQYGTASRKELYCYRRLRSEGIETPDREQAWQSIGCGIHLGSISKLISVCSVLNDCLINCYLTHCNTGKLAIDGKGNGRSRVAAITGFRRMYAVIIVDNEVIHVLVLQELHCLFVTVGRTVRLFVC